MYTWKLFVHGFLGWGASDNAIFIRDANRAPIWREVVQQVARFRTAWVLLGLVWVIVGILFVHNLLFFFVPPLIIFMLALALTLGPLVVEERMKSNWEFLLTVPYDMSAILLAKIGGALWHIRYLTYAIGILLMCVSAGVGAVSLTLIPVDIGESSGWYGPALYGLLFLMPILGSLLFIWDRMQQYSLMAVAALASGTSAPSLRSALSTSAAVVMLIWLVEVAVTEVFLSVEQGGPWQPNYGRILSVAALGPIAKCISDVDLIPAALFIAGMLVLREVLLRRLWRWTLDRAQL